jgi:hypothetical protein
MAVSTSSASIAKFSAAVGTSIRASPDGSGGASVATVRTSGQTATSIDDSRPAITSSISQAPSAPSMSTEPERPSPAAPERSATLRMSVSESHV